MLLQSSTIVLLVSIIGLSEQASDFSFSGLVYKPPRCLPPVLMTNSKNSTNSDIVYRGGCVLPPIPIFPNKTEQPVPLTSISVQATVRAWAYDVTAELNYVNKIGQAIECQFVFPMPDSAAVYKLEATIAGRKLRAEVRNRTEAEDIYQTAVASGQGAALLESQTGSPDVYRIMLGNLPPNETAVVKIGYAMPIERDLENGNLIVSLPVVLNPRYVPLSDLIENNADGLKGNYFPNVPYVAVSNVHYTMKFGATIDMGIGAGQIGAIQSGNVSDVLQTVFTDNNKKATVTLTSNFSQDHDFRLFINVTQRIQRPVVYVEPQVQLTSEDSVKSWLSYDIAAAWFEPLGSQTASATSTDEYWFIVDRSGSMMGDKIKSAKAALLLVIKSLPLGCKFNIIGFGSTYAALFPDSTEYSETSVNTATSYANALDADMGGTEILEPLRYVYGKSKTGNNRRFIILMTDGEVSNTNDVIDIARQNSATTRVYSVGIGEGASTALVNGVARVTNGLSEFVRSTSDDRLQTKVVGLLKATTLPSVDNIVLNWPITNGGKVSMLVPNGTLPSSAVRGRAVMQYAVIDRTLDSVTGSASLTASYMNNGSPVPISSQVAFTISDESPVDDPMPLHRLAAKARLVELTDSYLLSRNEDKKKEAIAISIATGVLCEFTAIVAVDPSTNRLVNDSTGKPLRVNIERPTVYDMSQMFGGGVRGRIGPQILYGRPQSAGASMSGGMMTNGVSFSMGARPNMLPSMAVYDRGPAGPAAMLPTMRYATSTYMMPTRQNVPTTSSAPSSSFDSLIQLQKFDGSWIMSNAFVTAVSAPGITSTAALTSTAKQAIQGMAPNKIDDDTISTLIGIAVLRRRFANIRSQWELLEPKAVNFVRGKPDMPNDIDPLLTQIGLALKL